jgi:two-component system sensor histidine kinase/response regulator
LSRLLRWPFFFLLKLIIDIRVEQSLSPYLFLFIPVVVAAWHGGRGPGIFALALAFTLVSVFFLPRGEKFWDWELWVRSLMFVAEGLLICFLAGHLHQTRTKAITYAKQATDAATDTQRHVEQLTQTQEDLLLARTRFRQLLDSNVVGVFVIDDDDVVTSANGEFLRICSRTATDLETRKIEFGSVFTNQDFLTSFDAGQPCDAVELELVASDGKPVPVLLGGVSLGGGGDKAIFILVELTEIRQTQQSLEQALAEADVANRAKTDFLANVSHELRTPMNAIVGMTDLALQGELSESTRQQLEICKDSAETLMHLLNDLLDFSKMQSGKFELEEELISLRGVIETTMRSLAMQAHQKGLEIGINVEASVPDALVGDDIRIGQILNNLANNAIKFTEQGEVVVSVSVESLQNEVVELRFEVADTGIGISEADLARIFAPFTQADSSTTRQYHGSGLGLTICRELVRSMNGRLWCKSEVGVGSRFFFTIRLPVDQSSSSLRPLPEKLDRLKGLEALVVDDNKTNRMIVTSMLQQWGVTCQEAAGGAEALTILEKREEPFALLLVDALMPGMDGFELSQRILAENRRSQITILMLSSSSRDEFATRSRNIGLDGYLEKPIGQNDLLQTILRTLGGPTLDTYSIPRYDETEKFKDLNILVAEDTPANQKLMESILSRRGHHVTVAHNGRDAVDQCQNTRYDVVLMDVQMPTMDGYQATAALRSAETDGETPMDVPIIALTAHAMHGDREKCLAAGMDDYVSKPVDAKDLIRLIETIAAEKLKEANMNVQISDAVPHVPNGADSTAGLSEALRRLDGDKDLLVELIEMYKTDAPELHGRLASAIESKDWKTIERTAHSLKGLAATLGGTSAGAAAAELEVAANKSQQDVSTECSRAIEASRQFIEFLERVDVNRIEE